MDDVENGLDRTDVDWFKSAVFYEVLIRSFRDSSGDGVGDLQGPHREARLSRVARRRLPVASPVLPFAAQGRRLRRRRLHGRRRRHRHHGRLPGVPRRRALPRHPGDHRRRHEPHLGSAPLVPGLPQRPRRAVRRLLRVERHRRALLGGSHHLRRHRAVQLDVGSGAPAVLLAPLLQPPARPQLREPRGAPGDARRAEVLARRRGRRVPARRGALPVRGGGHQRREPRPHARVPQEGPQVRGRQLPGPRAARRGEPVAGRRRRLLWRPGRRRRRMPHVLPLPRDAAHLHGGAPRVALPHQRDPGPDARRFPSTASGASSCATTTSSRSRW